MSDAIQQQKGHIQEDLELTLRDSLKSLESFGTVRSLEGMAVLHLQGPVKCR